MYELKSGEGHGGALWELKLGVVYSLEFNTKHRLFNMKRGRQQSSKNDLTTTNTTM